MDGTDVGQWLAIGAFAVTLGGMFIQIYRAKSQSILETAKADLTEAQENQVRLEVERAMRVELDLRLERINELEKADQINRRKRYELEGRVVSLERQLEQERFMSARMREDLGKSLLLIDKLDARISALGGDPSIVNGKLRSWMDGYLGSDT